MAHGIKLPDPWKHLETITGEKRDQLDSIAGTGLTYDDLGEHDVYRRSPEMMEPRSRKSWLVMGYRWQRIRNTDTGVEVLVRLQTFDGTNQVVSSVIYPMNQAEPTLTGTDLRSLPVAAIAAAYSHHEQSGNANLRTFFELIGEIHDELDPLAPLPPASGTDKFAALVANQYSHIENHEPGSYVAGRMAEINEKPLATVQRWVTQARKANFLPPTASGRRPNV